MSLTKEEVLNSLYNAGLITVGAAGVSMASKQTFKRKPRRNTDGAKFDEDGSRSGWWIITRKIRTEKNLGPIRTL